MLPLNPSYPNFHNYRQRADFERLEMTGIQTVLVAATTMGPLRPGEVWQTPDEMICKPLNI